ncbi:NAD(P)/FAD-dependent oxidoreductase [Oricola cellulosilytica]|uniref:NAD(P)/FAD-dependent oxidoreductase n=1 Tax=Oricola cellulosilytica TaxID=1429082 RepID=A0A4R0PG62_9HYPH|nr:NAD(P)/FAD-dependent oxidoreductase [Oricola cellulosilytica]TCD16078.1 NAD(P)/FAD-dependent oxidoreductase [Oricola cellulosilytica]
MTPRSFDVVILGAGAAGLFCAGEAGRRGRSVLVVDHARAPGEKIRISGGGRCNFTNIHASPKNFLSENPHFCISALKRFTAADFLSRVEARGIAWHEKTLGQLFCDGSATQIVMMLTDDLAAVGGVLELSTVAEEITRSDAGFFVRLSSGPVTCSSLVIATGGKSIPKIGASGFAYRIAEQFGLRVTETRPGLVPLTFEPHLLERIKPLTGVSTQARVSHGQTAFDEALLFTHRGLSGPAILQVSNFWREGDAIGIDLVPGADMFAELREARQSNGKQEAQTVIGRSMPKVLAQFVTANAGAAGPLAGQGDTGLQHLAAALHRWQVKPSGSEGYRTAEVTLGGIDTDGLDQKTMAAKSVPGLHFIGEALDVTGWLGGYNFQWAWSSGWAAGQAV